MPADTTTPPARAGLSESAALGLAARAAVPVESQGDLVLGADRPDPVGVLEAQGATRLADLLPVRYGRMVATPFTFFRGAAAVMAADLATGPTSGLEVQLCGDAHLSNFGLFASPERTLLFDVNDFDETFPGPWEWDVKRLATSLVVAGRDNGLAASATREAALAAVRRYQDALSAFGRMRRLDVWYSRAAAEDIRELLREAPKRGRKAFDKTVAAARANDSLRALGKLTTLVDGVRRIKADPPLLIPVSDLLPDVDRDRLEAQVRGLLAEYRATLPSDRAFLLDRYEFVDMARKLVGVGSVGTRCWIILLSGRTEDDPLFLQVKEAQASVLAPHVPATARTSAVPANEGARVVEGQRLMQAASDIFLGWQRVPGIDGATRDFYVRQLRDQKGSADVSRLSGDGLALYGKLCAWTLARAHARSGDAVAISAYFGEDDALPRAVAAFAERYADQNERDHAALGAAVREGRLPARPGV